MPVTNISFSGSGSRNWVAGHQQLPLRLPASTRCLKGPTVQGTSRSSGPGELQGSPESDWLCRRVPVSTVLASSYFSCWTQPLPDRRPQPGIVHSACQTRSSLGCLSPPGTPPLAREKERLGTLPRTDGRFSARPCRLSYCASKTPWPCPPRGRFPAVPAEGSGWRRRPKAADTARPGPAPAIVACSRIC